MDQFIYTNIFDTKGIEYIIIIGFLLLIIPFWIIINHKRVVTGQIRSRVSALSADILKIPQGIFCSKNHTWSFLGKSGIAKVGLDDFILHITGEVKICDLRNPGDTIKKGDLLAEIEQNGKLLKIYSPVSGKIADANTDLYKNVDILNNDPYGNGWIYKIRPSSWISETGTCFLGEEALVWSKKELARFKDFLALSVQKYSPENSLVILQDGGEICGQPLSELPAEVWHEFQQSFLD
jgi:glycine cleavage system H protein